MSTLLVEQDGPLAIVRLDKGRGNAIDDALLADLTDWSGEAARDDTLRGIMLASAHPKLFCPGLDLLSLVDLDREAMGDFMGRFAATLWSLYGLVAHPLPHGLSFQIFAGFTNSSTASGPGFTSRSGGVRLRWTIGA